MEVARLSRILEPDPGRPIITIPVREAPVAPVSLPVSYSHPLPAGPRVVRRWEVADEIASCNAGTRMAEAFREAIGTGDAPPR